MKNIMMNPDAPIVLHIQKHFARIKSVKLKDIQNFFDLKIPLEIRYDPMFIECTKMVTCSIKKDRYDKTREEYAIIFSPQMKRIVETIKFKTIKKHEVNCNEKSIPKTKNVKSAACKKSVRHGRNTSRKSSADLLAFD